MDGKFRVRYRRARVAVLGTKPERCECCGRKGRLELHHWEYGYATSEVRKDPQLALLNTNWYCYRCHKWADLVRNWFGVPIERLSALMRDYNRVRAVI